MAVTLQRGNADSRSSRLNDPNKIEMLKHLHGLPRWSVGARCAWRYLSEFMR